MVEHVDVVIVGAGLSGIGGACHLKRECPQKSFVILEGRETMGGTWDLFRYPGVRSDSDMYTLGYRFRPWREAKAMAGAPAILNYIRDTAAEYGVDKTIRYNHRVQSASWSSDHARWTVKVETCHDKTVVQFTCNFLYLCTGYYDYESGYTPEWPGVARFRGRIVHPQKWPEELDYAGKRIVVIGSGATAVTLVPAMAERAAHVTMLQRSPTYIVSRPSRDGIARRLQRRLPRRLADRLVRWKNVLLGMFFFSRARKKPERVKQALLKLAAEGLPPDFDVARHLSPSYNPWDQRLCLIPDGDLFEAIKKGKVAIATDGIERFTAAGLALASGEELRADIVVTATGLVVKLLGGIALEVDGEPVNVADRISYKGMMLSDVPNLAVVFGYTNASWTLKCDLTSRYVCRLLNHMDRRGLAVCMPRLPDGPIDRQPMLDFSSGYVRRAEPFLPKQGPRPPWRVHQKYVRDLAALRFGTVEDGVMEFRRGSGCLAASRAAVDVNVKERR